MKKPKKSEKLLLEEISISAKNLMKHQRGLEVGSLIALIRSQLRMSQRSLAKRAEVPQSTISRIESGNLQPNISTLQKIMNAIGCDLLITAVPKIDLETIRRNQAMAKAEKKIRYLRGTMSLEKQEPDQKLLKELLDDEVKVLLESPGSKLWEDEL